MNRCGYACGHIFESLVRVSARFGYLCVAQEEAAIAEEIEDVIDVLLCSLRDKVACSNDETDSAIFNAIEDFARPRPVVIH